MNGAFGRNLEFNDIYQHVTSPEQVFLLNHRDKIIAMGSYNKRNFVGNDCLIVEGIAVVPEMQGRGIFKEITDAARHGEQIICLRTQNPRMYGALQKYCDTVFPGDEKAPYNIEKIRDEFAKYLNCKIDENGIIKGYYGGLFYGIKPTHQKVDPLFQKLGVNLENGDGLLVIGERKYHFNPESLEDCFGFG